MSKIPLSYAKQHYKFTNWSESFVCYPEVYFEPQTIDEIKKVLSLARLNKKCVRVIGNGNSPSDLCGTRDYMLSLKHCNKILEIKKEDCTVRVQPGILLSDLNKVLHDNGLAISVLGSVTNISLAGAMSTGTHGSGKNYGIIASYVKDLEILLESGEKIYVSREKDPATFKAAVVSLGTFGVIISVTLKCEPAFKLEHIQYPATLNHVLDSLDTQLDTSDHFRFVWFPHTENVTMWHTKRTNKPYHRQQNWFWDYFIGFHLLQLVFWLSSFIPFVVPWINQAFYTLLYTYPRQLVDESFYVFQFECLFHQYVNEWAIPRENTAKALRDLKAWITNSRFPAHFPIEVRFVKEDDLYLSPSNGRDSCYINIIMYRPYNKSIELQPYWAVYEEIMRKHGGRPHWAKAYVFNQEDCKNTYKHWTEFCDIRQKLDPTGMFLNDNTRRLFIEDTLSDSDNECMSNNNEERFCTGAHS